MVKRILVIGVSLVLLFFIFKLVKKVNFNTNYEVGQPIDSLNNVKVYFNGGVDNVEQRNTKDGYNLGLEFQCVEVEFVKRYYYQHYNHKMPDSYGHAKSFFDVNISDGSLNKQRNLIQFVNPSKSKPKTGDLIVMSGSLTNRYGHVAIISKVKDNTIEIIQQNPGPFSPSRESIAFEKTSQGEWKIKNDRVLGWLRK